MKKPGLIGPILAILFAPTLVVAQATAPSGAALEAEAEHAIRRAYAAWNAGDVDALVRSGEGWTAGFGLRTRAPRNAHGPAHVANLTAGLRQWYASLEYFETTIDELHLAAHGNVVVAWGFHTERLKHRNRPPEVLRVRMSATMRRNQDGTWTTILSHRDIQPFDAQERYVPVAASAADFVGSWELMAFEARAEDGSWASARLSAAPKPVGLIMYDAQGNMSVQLSGAPRTLETSGGDGEWVNGYVAYYGTYEVDPDRGHVIHHRRNHVNPAIAALDVVRAYEFAGDTLTLTIVPDLQYRLRWKRVR